MPSRQPLSPPPYNLDRDLLEREVIIEVFRASGPGGQHVNRTESALRLTHLPSGVVVVAQDSPSQHRNRAIAFERLVKRLERLNYVAPPRIPTRPTLGSRKRRVEGKKLVGARKRTRGKVRGDE
jgi:protein subunit release factor A